MQFNKRGEYRPRNHNTKHENQKLIELAIEKLAELFISQIEFNKEKNKNIYEKRGQFSHK